MTAEEFKAMPNWEKIRTLSGMYPMDPQVMSGRLALICLISRVEMGDADQEFLDTIINKSFGVQDDIETDGQSESTIDPE